MIAIAVPAWANGPEMRYILPNCSTCICLTLAVLAAAMAAALSGAMHVPSISGWHTSQTYTFLVAMSQVRTTDLQRPHCLWLYIYLNATTTLPHHTAHNTACDHTMVQHFITTG